MPSLSQTERARAAPFPLFIFILTLEPLLRRLRANPDVKGIDIKKRTYKLAAFADDILLFLTEPLTTLPNLLKDFNTFKTLTNLQINFTKSNALNITISSETCKQCQTTFPFTWHNRAITYLGIQLPNSLSDLYSLKHLPLLQTIIRDLTKWASRLFSWFGRAAIIKMNILPRILYLLQTISIKIPPASFSTYRTTCITFVWGKLKPRLSYLRLTSPKLKGGIGLPDIRKYQQASHLARIIDWNIYTKHKDWIQLEQAILPLPLAQLPWITPQHPPRL